jgi:hypothetical protein
MFGRLFKRKTKSSAQYVVARLNARLQPINRGAIFEDPLNKVLTERKAGEVCGGGSALSEVGEIECCDIEIQIAGPTSEAVDLVIKTLETLGAPKGSTLRIEAEDREVEFGVADGLAVYLNGTDLSPETYAEADPDFICNEFVRLLGDEGRLLSMWHGPTETALYVYGRSFQSMKERLGGFLKSYPLCQKCRVVQIA